MRLQPFQIFHVDAPAEFCDIPEGTCLLAYRGSIAHGMYVPKSDPNSIDDVDLMGIVIGRPSNYFGLHEWGSRGTWEHKQGKWDCVFYEIRKMFSLLLAGNPNVLSLLWTKPEHCLYLSEEGKLIRDARELFVGRHVYHAFAGYAHAQLEKMETRDPIELREYLAVTAELKRRGSHPNHKGEVFEAPQAEHGIEKDVAAWNIEKLLARLRHFQKKGENIGYLGDKRKRLVLEHGYDAKNAAHCIRLLRMCCEFLSTGEMIVYRTTDAGELLDIKRGAWPLSQVKELAAQLFENIKAARDHCTLPEFPDRDGAEALLVDILSRATLRVWSERDLLEAQIAS